MKTLARFLNETVYCRLAPSPIHGIGVFAIRDMRKGTPISDYVLQDRAQEWLCYMDEEEFSNIRPEIQALILDQVVFDTDEPMVFLSPNASQDMRTFLNHSSEPNTDGLVTTRDVAKGEELTEDFTKLARSVHPLTRNHMPFL